MSEANKSLMLSEAEIIEAINSDSLISVSLGAGQPQKNVKMSTLATVAAGIMSNNGLFPFVNSIVTNVDAISKSGIYAYNDTTMNTVLGYTWGMVIHFENNQNWGTFQIATTNKDNDNVLYFRKRLSANWGNWVPLM